MSLSTNTDNKAIVDSRLRPRYEIYCHCVRPLYENVKQLWNFDVSTRSARAEDVTSVMPHYVKNDVISKTESK